MVSLPRLGATLLASLLLAAAVPAQQPAAPLSQSGDVAAPPKALRFDVVVTRRSGPPVAGLQAKDFTVLDNKAPQALTSFRALNGTEEPIEVILLVDSVNTTFQQVAYERGEVDKFLKANEGQLAHPTTLAVLTDKGTEIEPNFTTNGNALAASLDQHTIGLRAIGRSTGFYGAGERMQISITALQQLTAHEATRPGRKLLLWLSPGWPLLAGPGVDSSLSGKQRQSIFDEVVRVSTQLQAARMTVYAINPLGALENPGRTFYYEQFVKGLNKPGDASLGNLALQVLATQTGGLVVSSSGIAGLLQQCMDDTKAYYELSFQPASPDGKLAYHSVEIRMTDPSLMARGSTGYYALP